MIAATKLKETSVSSAVKAVVCSIGMPPFRPVPFRLTKSRCWRLADRQVLSVLRRKTLNPELPGNGTLQRNLGFHANGKSCAESRRFPLTP
jgi:hypothetical protein